MDREAAVFEALRALTYSEMIDFASQLRDTADSIGRPGDNTEDWARVIQSALDAFDDREPE